jgi:hypothetical protein
MPETLEPEERLETCTRLYWQSTPWQLLSMAGLLGIVDFTLLPVGAAWPPSPKSWSIYFIHFCAGAMAAQFAAVSMWFSWSRGEVLVRMLIAGGVSVILFGLWLAGLYVATWIEPRWRLSMEMANSALVGSAFTCFMFTGAMLPLWILRKTCGWGIVLRDQHEPRSFTQQISIRDILIATTVVALLITLAQTVHKHGHGFQRSALFMISIYACIYSCVTVIPLAFWMLRPTWHQRGWIYALLYAAMSPLIFFALLLPFVPLRSFPQEQVKCLILMCYTYSACLLRMLLACRWKGFRLVTAWDAPLAAER